MYLLGISSEVSHIVRELGLERVDALSHNSIIAPMSSMPPSVGAGVRGLLKNFLNPRLVWHQSSCFWMICCLSWRHWRKLILDIPSLCDLFYHRRGRGFARNSIVTLVESVYHLCLVWRKGLSFSPG